MAVKQWREWLRGSVTKAETDWVIHLSNNIQGAIIYFVTATALKVRCWEDTGYKSI